MTKYEKLLEKFKNDPTSLRYSEIERILLNLGFHKTNGQGSHVKFSYPKASTKVILAVHNNDCKEWQKTDTLKALRNSNLIP